MQATPAAPKAAVACPVGDLGREATTSNPHVGQGVGMSTRGEAVSDSDSTASLVSSETPSLSAAQDTPRTPADARPGPECARDSTARHERRHPVADHPFDRQRVSRSREGSHGPSGRLRGVDGPLLRALLRTPSPTAIAVLVGGGRVGALLNCSPRQRKSLKENSALKTPRAGTERGLAATGGRSKAV